MVIFIVAVFNYMVYGQYIKNIRTDESKQTLLHAANSISRTLDFYQSVADKIATQSTVIDLLQFGTKVEAQVWANNMQKLVPESIGFALFDINGEVRGVQADLRLSDRCMQDMQRRFHNLPIPRPPVHSKIENLAHYDIVSPVRQDGENIGLLFVSFSVDTIRKLLVDMSNEQQQLKIITPNGFEIANGRSIDASEVTVIRRVVENTDWIIELTSRNMQSGFLISSLLLSNLIAFLLISITLYVSMKRFFKVIVSDFEKLSWIMSSIRAGTYTSDHTMNVSLKEAEHIVRFITHTAVELNEHQEKLRHFGVTDELTGLGNRRILNTEIDNYLQHSNGAQKIYLVIFDLDYFKKINDVYGHDVGDYVLTLLSETLLKYSADDDICTRSGGDEFIMLLAGYTKQDVLKWYQDICSYMRSVIDKYNVEHKSAINIGISAGATLINKGELKSTVLKRADEALYLVKDQGRGSIEFL